MFTIQEFMETHIGAYDIHMNGILPEYWEAMDILYEQLDHRLLLISTSNSGLFCCCVV